MDDSVSRRPTVAQVLLGLFVVGQLCFIAAANLLGLVPHGHKDEGELSDSRQNLPAVGQSGLRQRLVDSAAECTDDWARLTGQVQAWWLFAPEFTKVATFPIVELRWDSQTELSKALKKGSDPFPAKLSIRQKPDKPESAVGGLTPFSTPSKPVPAPVYLQSVIEPADPLCYFRPPGSNDRLFHYEIRLGLIMNSWEQGLVDQHPDRFRQMFRERLRRQWKSIRAYLRWRMQEFMAVHPNVSLPTQAILIIRIFRSPAPGQPIAWEGPTDVPFARWQLAAADPKKGSDPLTLGGQTPFSDPDYVPLELCDPVSRQFVRVPLKD